MHFQHLLAPSSNVLRQRVLCNKASSRGRLTGQNRFCAISCNCTKQFCVLSCYCTKRVLCNKASLFIIMKYEPSYLTFAKESKSLQRGRANEMYVCFAHKGKYWHISHYMQVLSSHQNIGKHVETCINFDCSIYLHNWKMKKIYNFPIFRRHFRKSLFFCISFHFQNESWQVTLWLKVKLIHGGIMREFKCVMMEICKLNISYMLLLN